MRVQVGDVRLFFEVVGPKLALDGPELRERPTLVVLHGGPGFDHSIFRPELDGLADVAQVVYLDHRGQGRSDSSTPDRWSLDTWADDLRGFCDALELDRPVVYGSSFGGFVAMAYAVRHPDHPAGLILGSTALRAERERSYDAFERLGGPEARAVAKRTDEDPSEENMREYIRVCLPLYSRSAPNPDKLARVIQRLDVAEAFARGEERTFDFGGKLGGIRCPVLVIAGELDPITPPANAEDVAAELPPELVRYELVRGAGHGIIRDDPDALVRLIREFLAGLPAVRGPA